MSKRQNNLDDILNSKQNKSTESIESEEKQLENQMNKEKINLLVQQIEKHRDLYYNAAPEITDAKYDELENELRILDPNNPILFTVGADSSEIFTKTEHVIPMGSQGKVSTPNEFKKWAEDRGFNTFLIQYKLDGISLELQYKSGVFQCGVTRGNGIVGDDVSINVMKMKGFVPRLSTRFTGGIRAEVVLFHDLFEKKYSDKQNCRNTAAGIVRRKDGIGCEDLNLIFYDAISLSDDVSFIDEIQKLKWMKNENLPTIKTKTVKTIQEVIDVREDVMNNIRDSLEYDIDGLVIKCKDIDLEDMKRAKPIKQVAFKFQAEEIESTLINVEWTISGHNYTPVAIIEPVRLMGTTVSRASLANPNLIKDMGIKIGAEVIVTKRGDIIPKIERVVKIPQGAKDIVIPNMCEECNTELINEGTRLYCPNEECPKRNFQRLVRWIRILGVKHFSEKLLLQPLFKTGKVEQIADLYQLNVSDLNQFEGVKETSAKKALNNLFAVKEISLAKFIGGFNIENIAELSVKKVIDAGYDTLEKIKSTNIGQLAMIDGYAEITAENLLNGINKFYPQMLEVLNTNKISIKKSVQDGKLNGLTFCFTGKLNEISRSEAEDLVLKLGGEPKKSVVKNLSYLVTNETTPTSKYLKAQEQGTKIITENEFLQMISE
ncbi:MAG: NAD-dependent DNA ligase LigA [Candidatus Lokiarchaeota archaeon]|nr:NAD-dependent DNA ligase LigA [Candidatus Lokiarchaeota archaeon]